MATMPSRLQIAQRLHQALQAEIEHGIEIERLLSEPRYARDVLLVCDALPGGELGTLAALFRAASPPAPGWTGGLGHTQHDSDWPRDSAGFGASRPPAVGAPTDAEPAAPSPAAPAKGWRPRWVGK